MQCAILSTKMTLVAISGSGSFYFRFFSISLQFDLNMEISDFPYKYSARDFLSSNRISFAESRHL